MSSLSIPTVTAPLPAANVRPHGHGHKKDSLLDPAAADTDSGSSTAAQVPVGSAQTMFGRLFGAISQLLGAPAVPTAIPAAPNTNPAASATSAGSKVNLMA
jgi:hypothetical protein